MTITMGQLVASLYDSFETTTADREVAAVATQLTVERVVSQTRNRRLARLLLAARRG